MPALKKSQFFLAYITRHDWNDPGRRRCYVIQQPSTSPCGQDGKMKEVHVTLMEKGQGKRSLSATMTPPISRNHIIRFLCRRPPVGITRRERMLTISPWNSTHSEREKLLTFSSCSFPVSSHARKCLRVIRGVIL